MPQDKSSIIGKFRQNLSTLRGYCPINIFVYAISYPFARRYFMEKIKFSKYDALDIVRSALFAIILSILLVMAFAIIAKFANIAENVIEPVNIAIKILSVAAGCLIGVRHDSKGLIKGIVIGLLYSGLTYLIFATVCGDFTQNPMTVYDIIACIVAGVLSGILAVNVKRKKA